MFFTDTLAYEKVPDGSGYDIVDFQRWLDEDGAEWVGTSGSSQRMRNKDILLRAASQLGSGHYDRTADPIVLSMLQARMDDDVSALGVFLITTGHVTECLIRLVLEEMGKKHGIASVGTYSQWL